MWSRKIQNVTVRPTESERTIADQLIRDVSEQFKEEISKCGLTEEIQEKIRLYVRSTITKLDYDDYSVKIRIEKVVLSSIIGLGPIDPFLHDPSVTEIIVQRYNCISVERNGLVEETDAEFVSEEHLMTVINRIIQPVGRQINLHSPLVDARLKGRFPCKCDHSADFTGRSNVDDSAIFGESLYRRRLSFVWQP